MRWLFHVVRAADVSWGSAGRYAPPSLVQEGFIHASYKDAVRESARLYFELDADLRVLAIDPRRLDVPIDVASTPRGPMPHIHGPIPVDAVRVLTLSAFEHHADRVTGTRFGLAAFEGMTLLDLVGPLDALGRIVTMGFDETASVEVLALTRPASSTRVLDVPVWNGNGAMLLASRYRPPLDGFDVLVLPGGPSTHALETDREVLEYLKTFPENHLLATVCTGSRIAGAMGRLQGKRATSHASALEGLASYGASPRRERVVDEGQVVTSGGVTSGIDLGLHLVARFYGHDAARAVAERMEART